MAALTWPAMWLKTRGLKLTGAKYQEIMLEILAEAHRVVLDAVATRPRAKAKKPPCTPTADNVLPGLS